MGRVQCRPTKRTAKEAGLLYAAIAMSTDYDCWREGGEPVTVEAVMKTMGENSEKVKKVLQPATDGSGTPAAQSMRPMPVAGSGGPPSAASPAMPLQLWVDGLGYVEGRME